MRLDLPFTTEESPELGRQAARYIDERLAYEAKAAIQFMSAAIAGLAKSKLTPQEIATRAREIAVCALDSAEKMDWFIWQTGGQDAEPD